MRTRAPATLVVALLVGAVACTNPSTPVRGSGESITILSPRPGQEYWDGDPVVLMADAPGPVLWETEGGTSLATTATATVTLAPGTQLIAVTSPLGASASVRVTVKSTYLEPGYHRQQMIKAGTSWVRPTGVVEGLGANLDPQTSVVTPSPATDRTTPVVRDRRHPGPDHPGRWPQQGGRLVTGEPVLPPLGTVCPFRIADLLGSGYQTRDFLLTHRTPNLEVWVDQAAGAEGARLNEEWVSRFQTVLQDRLIPLWGPPPDVDHNGRVRLLFSPLLNQQNVAVGFFNPSDLYPRVDVGQEQNPLSNEGEYLYLAVPSDSHPFFSLPSLAATVAHEGFHLVHYGIRVLVPWLNGQAVPEETVALSEGLAHLSESLCGYGVSGGGLVYADQYLQQPEKTSLTADGGGTGDSLARRGAWLLFLGWIHQSLPDGPGILRRVLRPSEVTGWGRLSQVLGASTDTVFLSWAQSLRDGSSPLAPRDPITGEPVVLTGQEGSVAWAPGYTVSLNGPRRIAFGEPLVLPPHSLVFWNREKWSGRVVVPGSLFLGRGFLTLDWVGR